MPKYFPEAPGEENIVIGQIEVEVGDSRSDRMTFLKTDQR